MAKGPVAAEHLLDPLKWAQPAQDLGRVVGLADLLIGLQLLATDDDRADAASTSRRWDAATPGSMQVIRSGALAVTTWWTKRIAVVGGVTGLAGAIGGALRPLKTQTSDAITVALIAGGAAVLAATAIALAVFVKGDLDARGRATAARHGARAEVAAAFLRATASLPRSPGSSKLSLECRVADGLLQLRCGVDGSGADTWVTLGGVDGAEVTRPVPPAFQSRGVEPAGQVVRPQ